MRPVDRLWLGRKLILMAGDVFVFVGALAVISNLRDAYALTPWHVLPYLPVLAFMLLATYAAGLYELRVFRDFVALSGGVLASAVACLVFGTTYFYVLAQYLKFAPKATLLLIVIGAHLGMLIWRRAVLATTGFKVVDLKILILGDSDYRDSLRGEFNLAETLEPNVSLVVVDRSWANRNPDQARRVLSAAIAQLIPIVNIDEFHESQFGKVSPEHAHDLAWALDHVLPRAGSSYFKVKRVLDVIAAAALMAICAPLMVLATVGIIAIDRTSPLYSQMRIGYLGRSFRLWKFSTMRNGADAEGPFSQFSLENDPRITRFGYILRRLRLDELPQLWNVVRGDMSLVGPRPEWTKEVEVLEKTIPTYTLRYLVPPGITGWAQVYFRATNNPLDSMEKHNYDLYYLKNFSLALDFSIMLKTVKRVFLSDPSTPSVPAPNLRQPRADADTGLDIASIVGRS
jgi:lipopolysaccharide/colanic/teichoic acid biosynthesis glycosyltransferase